LEETIFFGEKMLRTAVGQFLKHYHGERNHRGLGNQLIDPEVLKQITVFELEGFDPQSSNDTSTESPQLQTP
jgi:hypothetical protein